MLEQARPSFKEITVYCFSVRCHILPGKEDELDSLLAEKSKGFWLSQPGVSGFRVYGEVLMGWSERMLMIDVDDLTSLQSILNSDIRKQIRSEFMNYVTNVQTQILERVV